MDFIFFFVKTLTGKTITLDVEFNVFNIEC